MDPIMDAIQQGTGNVIGYFINFGEELGVIEQVLLYMIAPALGVSIAIWGVFDLIKMKNPRIQNRPTSGGIAAKLIIAPLLFQIGLTMGNFSESMFGNNIIENNENMAASYVQSAQGAGDPVEQALLIGVAFLAVLGWIGGIRAMVAFARVGSPNENGFELMKSGAVRLAVSTILCATQFVVDDIAQSFTGTSGAFTSTLGL
jgi:protein-S-isoprenylcysteine O-methyltransferase Ste14